MQLLVFWLKLGNMQKQAVVPSLAACQAQSDFKILLLIYKALNALSRLWPFPLIDFHFSSL